MGAMAPYVKCIDPGKTLVHIHRGFLGLKTPLFGVFFKIAKKSMCMSVQWLSMVLNSNLNVLTPKNAPLVYFQ